MTYKIHEIEGYIQTIYLVEQDDKLLLLDGCARPDIPVVESFIVEKLNRRFSDLALVIATHAHPDHAGGLSFYKARGIKIAGPVELNSWYAGFTGFFTYWVDILLTWLVAINKNRGLKNIIFPRQIKLDLLLREGMDVPGFDGWSVLEAPGHTNVDLSIYHARDQIAYVADNFVGSKRNVFRPYPIAYPHKYRATLQKYINLGIENFMIAHYGTIKIPHIRINELINTTPTTPRRHTNTLPAIFLKLLKAFIAKLR